VVPPVARAATNRRNFLSLVGLGALATASGGALTACGHGSGGHGSATDTDKVGDILPRQKSLNLDVKPDIVSTRPVADGFTTFPSRFVDAVNDKPGRSGQTIKAITPAWGPAPPGLGQSAYLEAMNAKLGIAVDFSIQDGNTYGDKLNAILAARDVPDLLCVPSWEVAKLPRFPDAVKALFEDLTPYLKGDAVSAYPMLATFPTSSWRKAVWNDRLMSIPNPTDGPYPWILMSRRDLLDAAGLQAPKTIDELYETGKRVTDPAKGVWAFDDIFAMVQMFHKVPGSKEGWRRRADGTPEFKYETPEYRAAVEFMAKLYKDGLIHPDVVASKGADSKQLFASGKVVFKQDGMGAWQPLQAQFQKVTPTLNIQPVPVFSATGGDPLVWGGDEPISYTFIKKGLSKDRIQELLRVSNWCSAPFGTSEFFLREYGVEGKHYTLRGGVPVKQDLAFKEIQNQYFFISGRSPVVQPTPDTPNYVQDMLGYSNAMVKFLEKDPWDGLKLEYPAKFKATLVPTEDKMTDIVRGRRPVSDLDGVVKDWRASAGDEARAFMAKALSDAGR